MLGNILTANDKYPVRQYENLLTPVQMHLSSKLKTFSHFFVPFLETTLNFEDFERKQMIVIHTLFRKLQTVKDLVSPLSKKYRSEKPLTVNMLKGWKLFQNVLESTFILFFDNSEKT